MFKIIKSKEFRKLSTGASEADYYHELSNKYRKEMDEVLSNSIIREQELSDKILKLEEEVERLKSLSVKSNKNEVILQISDDMTTITPVVRWKDTSEGKMIELGMLPDKENTPYAIQIALMSIANEGLQQIVESFTSPLDKEE